MISSRNQQFCCQREEADLWLVPFYKFSVLSKVEMEIREALSFASLREQTQ